MELIPESAQAAELFGPFLTADNEDLLEQLTARAAEAEALVPDCVGVSLASLQEGITFTVVASGWEVDGVEDRYVFEHEQDDPLDEASWQRFARATAAHAVASTLTLPIVTAGDVLGSVNLYAASSRAFAGHHERLAAIFGAWAPGAVTNADLEFSTLRTAQQAPALLREQMRIAMAVGWLAETHHLDIDEARAVFDHAVLRAGVTPPELAETLLARRASEGGGQARDPNDPSG